MEQATVRAYDASGNVRVPTPVKIGDLIDYKRDGLSGYQQYRVIGIRVMDGGRLKLKVAAHGLAPRWITERGILRVIPQQAVA